MDKVELIVTALQQRIGELVSNYETQIAVLRAELTELSQSIKDKEEAIQNYNKSLEEKIQ